MYWAATPASTITSHSAACTTFFVVTTHSAAKTITAAMIPNPTFRATLIASSAGERSRRPGLDRHCFFSRSCFELRRLGHRLHPLAELVLVVQEVGDAGLGVLVLGAPEQGVERAHLDADAAVHAQRVVDVEAVEQAHRAWLAAGPAGRGQRLVALDVDAPVRARAGAQHAHRAVVLAQGDHAAGARRRRLLLLRVLHRLGALGDGAPERLQRHAEALHQPGHLRLADRHQTPPSTCVPRPIARTTTPPP